VTPTLLPAARFEAKPRGYPAWPDGARSVVTLTFDVDCDSMLHYLYPDDAVRRVGARSSAHYDLVAIERVLQLVASLGVQTTFFFPAWCIGAYPEVALRIVEAGHEIGLHGYVHERSVELPSKDVERYWLDRSVALFEKVLGISPQGWRAPMYSFSDHTAELIVERGFTYDSSLSGHDLPYLLTSSNGDVIELPIDWTGDDWPQFVQSIDFDYAAPIRSASAGVKVFEEEMETAAHLGGFWSTVWHPGVMGRPSRLLQLQRMLERFLASGEVSFPRMGDLAAVIAEGARAGAAVERISFASGGPVDEAVEIRSQINERSTVS
jgi:peptidoglycan/xylan/chitin deacetylase (PgdA/CDA1 family)